MLRPAFGVMRPKELVSIVANSARRGIREPSVVDSIRKLMESDLPPQPFSIPARRTLDDSCCSWLPSLCTESAVTTYSALDLDLFSQRIAVEPCAAPCLERACSAIAILEKLDVGNLVPLEPS